MCLSFCCFCTIKKIIFCYSHYDSKLMWLNSGMKSYLFTSRVLITVLLKYYYIFPKTKKKKTDYIVIHSSRVHSYGSNSSEFALSATIQLPFYPVRIQKTPFRRTLKRPSLKSPDNQSV